MKKRVIAAACVLLGVGGLVATSAPSASALTIGPLHVNINPASPPCLRVDVVIGGTDIGPLERPLCV